MRTLHKIVRTAMCLSLQLPLLAAVMAPAEAVPLLTGFGGPTGYGLPQNCVHPNDDGSYAGPPPATGVGVPIPITTAFPMGLNFFGNNYRAMYVNTNGNITFRGAVFTYTPMPFPSPISP